MFLSIIYATVIRIFYDLQERRGIASAHNERQTPRPFEEYQHPYLSKLFMDEYAIFCLYRIQHTAKYVVYY